MRYTLTRTAVLKQEARYMCVCQMFKLLIGCYMPGWIKLRK